MNSISGFVSENINIGPMYLDKHRKRKIKRNDNTKCILSSKCATLVIWLTNAYWYDPIQYMGTHVVRIDPCVFVITQELCLVTPISVGSAHVCGRQGCHIFRNQLIPASAATPVSPWLNYVPRKMPDVRSRCRFTNVRRFMYCMLHTLHVRMLCPIQLRVEAHISQRHQTFFGR